MPSTVTEPDVLGPKVGVPARTVSRILRRHQVPYLRELDPMTGEIIRSSKQTATHYERDNRRTGPHGRQEARQDPDGGGWRALGRAAGNRDRKTKIGYEYTSTHSSMTTRGSYSEILPDEKGTTCAGFLHRAAAYFAGKGIDHIERVMTDNAFAYQHATDMKRVCAQLGARHKFIKPHCPWQNGKVERLNRTLATEWAYRQAFTSNDARQAALAPWIEHYTERRHSALGGQSPISRLSPT